mmetsp:Transcript_73821/g.213853  ORF Transcript_73821/g.213853 Transcript_73821/m.213853 type:complete len:376 (+) Transcript_73821:159-1286(+)
MGGCAFKGAKFHAQVVDRQPQKEPEKVEEPAAAAVAAVVDVRGEHNSKPASAFDGNILDLFPGAQRRVSVAGTAVPERHQQKGFVDKLVIYGGEGTLPSARIGYACKKGLKPESPNQDDFCVFRADSVSIYGVFDGHGPYGHDISNFVQDALPRLLVQDPAFGDDPVQALTAAFMAAHVRCTEAEPKYHFDCSLSGTTATVALARDGMFHLAHVGDSRAVLARRRGNELQAEDLTEDHKPTRERERRRIQAAGGQVRRLDGDIPYRVFLNGKMYPGLAMTRSIGDTIGATAGVTCEPDVVSLKVQDDWRFVLLCSDGIWEFLSSQEAINIVGKYPATDVQKGVDALAAEAWDRWIREEGNVVDDITVICAYFNED